MLKLSLSESQCNMIFVHTVQQRNRWQKKIKVDEFLSPQCVFYSYWRSFPGNSYRLCLVSPLPVVDRKDKQLLQNVSVGKPYLAFEFQCAILSLIYVWYCCWCMYDTCFNCLYVIIGRLFLVRWFRCTALKHSTGHIAGHIATKTNLKV